MQDQLAAFRVPVPIPFQQRSAVGEVAIPIARTVAFVGKFVPVAGELIILAELATGRDIGGLGERIDRAERALDAALVLAPYAVAALRPGVRGAAEVVRLSRVSGRSVEETRAICQGVASASRDRKVLREAISSARQGSALTQEQRAAMDGLQAATDGGVLRRRTYKPSTTFDGALPAGAGATDKYGNITISPHGTGTDVALARAHESVHAFFSPKALNRLREFRADVGMTAYDKSALCRYLEEALAESYAQVTVNGLRALPDGLTFPVRNGYVTLHAVATEAAIGTISYAGVLYAVSVSVDRR
jgi:hypothetical protein